MITDKGQYIEYYTPNPACTLKEDTHQVNCVSWLKYNHPHLLFWHTVNEGKKHINSALRDEQAGLKKGVSDFVILIGLGGHGYPFAAIELKRTNKSGKAKSSPVSKDQKEFLSAVRERGGFAAVAYGLGEFKKAVSDMLNSTNS